MKKILNYAEKYGVKSKYLSAIKNLSPKDKKKVLKDKVYIKLLNKIIVGDNPKDFIDSRLKSKKIENEEQLSGIMSMFLNPDYSSIRRGKIVIKTINKKHFEIWKDLYLKDVNIEPILNYKEEKSKVKVETIYLGRNLEDLSSTLPREIKYAFLRQMLVTIGKIWKNGYVHLHPHLANWIVHNGKIYIIDAKLFEKLNLEKLEQDYNIILSNIVIFLNKDSKLDIYVKYLTSLYNSILHKVK